MNTQSDALEQHIANVYAQIGEAAKNKDLATIQRLNGKAVELEELKQQHTTIQQRIASLSENNANAVPPVASEQGNGKTRELPIEVTDGMKRRDLLTLTPHIKRGKIKIGDELIIEALPSGERFQTVVLEKGNKLRARGPIARFYRDANVNGGDYVVLTEVARGRWTLMKAPPGKYGLSALLA